MINFTDYEKTKVVYGIYSNISNRILPVFEETADAALEDLKLYGVSGYIIIKLEWLQAKLIYNYYISTKGGADGV